MTVRPLAALVLAVALAACAGSPAANTPAAGKSTKATTKKTPTPAPAALVATALAGGAKAYADGKGEAAGFEAGGPLAVAPDGTIWVSELSKSRLRKVTPAGEVTTVLSEGAFADGPVATAKIGNVIALAAGRDGALYFVDREPGTLGLYRIRKLEDDAVTTLAGGGKTVIADGVKAADLSLGQVQGVGVEDGGLVFFPLVGSVYAIQADGTAKAITTKDAPKTLGETIAKLAAAPGGAVAVMANGKQKVFGVEAEGTYKVLAGSGEAGSKDGKGAAAQFDGNYALCHDGKGGWYAADKNGIRHLGKAGEVTTLAPKGLTGSFTGLGVDAEGVLYAFSGSQVFAIE